MSQRNRRTQKSTQPSTSQRANSDDEEAGTSSQISPNKSLTNQEHAHHVANTVKYLLAADHSKTPITRSAISKYVDCQGRNFRAVMNSAQEVLLDVSWLTLEMCNHFNAISVGFWFFRFQYACSIVNVLNLNFKQCIFWTILPGLRIGVECLIRLYSIRIVSIMKTFGKQNYCSSKCDNIRMKSHWNSQYDSNTFSLAGYLA